jgi:hypothetical protein
MQLQIFIVLGVCGVHGGNIFLFCIFISDLFLVDDTTNICPG